MGPLRASLGLEVDTTEPEEPCHQRRPRTSARCEKPVDHGHDHIGRDTAGRWHVWVQA
jgi:hypothetical protein